MLKTGVTHIKHCWAWYRKLRQNYSILTSIMCVPYNSKHYNLDGSYKTSKKKENPHDRK